LQPVLVRVVLVLPELRPLLVKLLIVSALFVTTCLAPACWSKLLRE
jgi:hypothetical protein